MRKILKYIFIFILPVLFVCCEKRPTFTPGQGGSTGQGGNTGSGTADYSGLVAGNHPRMVMTDDDVTVIKEKLAAGTDANLAALHNGVIRYADRALTMKDLTHTLTGHRLLSVCTEASNRIIACAYAYRLTGDTGYRDQAIHDLETVTDPALFPDWNAGRHFLDVGEMTHGVGIGYDWLYNDLSQDLRKQIEEAIISYAFTPALKMSTDSNSSSFYGQATNWNQVCNGGLVCCALAIYETHSEEAQEIIDRAVETNRRAMEGMYSPDGNYPEGYGYWGYGTAFECVMLSAFETCLGTDFNLSGTSGFDRTGRWIMFLEGMNDEQFNYSDCAPGQGVNPPLWYLAYRFSDQSILYNELNKVKDGLYNSADPKYMPMAITYASKFDLNAIPAPEDKIWSGAGINPVVLVHGDWTFSDTDKMLGIKAGRADYSHGHMDVGSFVYDAYGERVSADLGLQSYGSTENLEITRWEIFRYNNYNHSTITINDALHKEKGRATFTRIIDTPTSKGGEIDMSDILSEECADASRTVTIENDNDLVVVDEITALYNKSADIRWTMVTKCVPSLDPENDRILLQGRGRNLYLTVETANGTPVELVIWPMNLKPWDQANPGYYETGFSALLAPTKSETFTVRISPEN